MENDDFIVIEGIHENPNNIDTLDEKTKIVHGPYNKKKAEEFAKGLIQKNIDNFYHRAWVIDKKIELNSICEECKKEDESVKQNLIMHSYKICSSCNLAKTIFPL
tara:strand:- start:97 stop:411 length:315 start_codon:yes stop_codon:yes gene_type:complete